MALPSATASLNNSLKCWKYLGIWPDGKHKTMYRCYSSAYIFIVLILYNIQQTLSLYYAPRKIELMIKEITFFFNVLAITNCVFMILYRKKTIIKIFKALDSEQFQGTDIVTKNILMKDVAHYKMYWKGLVGLGNFAYTLNSVVPIIANLAITSYQLQLPTFNYYFLSDSIKKEYFGFLYAYEFFSIYGIMMYDVTTDSFINGMLFFSITQMKILNNKFRNLKTEINSKLSRDEQERIHVTKLKECLRHYDSILTYCSDVQSIINFIMFVKFGLGSLLICVLLCGLLLPQTMESIMFMLFYSMAMVLQIFVPCWLGTQLTYQSQELVFAAYNSDWIPRTEPFKRSVKVFMERAKTPVVIIGFKLFPLSLETFTSIMKTAYSFVTLVRNFQEEAET
ncbi:odorant receptor 49b-like [Vanessa cardui]|uniref:odorant receptor 49b-like n=1 Tax=Vanessa cardui TaxID=171605 RepID=UPI001F13EC28|nr:odorant receptor 49b-like [Vanessa cardui]